MLSIQLQDSPLQLWKRKGDYEIWIKRDDISAFGFGTKIRRFTGFKNIPSTTPIIISGSYHGNYLATFSYLFANQGHRVISLARTSNPKLKTGNSCLVDHFSNELWIGSGKTFRKREDITYETAIDREYNFYEVKSKVNKLFPNGIWIPEYGFSKEGSIGLESLWEEISSRFSEFNIFLDMGSGLTYLSALRYFYNRNSSVKIYGVALGEKRHSWIDQWDSHLEKLGWKEGVDLPSLSQIQDSILEPSILPGFARVNQTLKQYTKDFYSNYGIPLEPIYSAKSIFTLEETIETKSIPPGRYIYVHQGGLLNWMSLYK
jgi:1-aminocyclopropane-1-carboxylate deaminase